MDKRLDNWAKRFATGCLSKKPYKTEESARKRAKQVFKKQGIVLHCYICPHCYNYHLTKRDPSHWARKVF